MSLYWIYYKVKLVRRWQLTKKLLIYREIAFLKIADNRLAFQRSNYQRTKRLVI